MSEMTPEIPERLTVREAERLRREYAYILNLATPENDPDGTVRDFFKRLRRFIRTQSDGKPANIKAWFDQEVRKVAPLAGLTASQIDAALEDAQPDKAADVQRELEKIRLDVRTIVERLGVDAGKIDFEGIVNEARRNGWDQQDIENRLRRDLGDQLQSGRNMMGDAGSFQTDLMTWAQRNGIGIDPSTAAKYVANMTLGIQSLEDAKQDIRETYLIGAYPAWEDKIRAGFDPWQISSPYRSTVANLLELDPEQVSLSDNLVKAGLQSTGADGKPRIMPLYEFEQQVRNDPRWQQTDNAYEAYTRVGQDLLRMFGFR